MKNLRHPPKNLRLERRPSNRPPPKDTRPPKPTSEEQKNPDAPITSKPSAEVSKSSKPSAEGSKTVAELSKASKPVAEGSNPSAEGLKIVAEGTKDNKWVDGEVEGSKMGRFHRLFEGKVALERITKSKKAAPGHYKAVGIMWCLPPFIGGNEAGSILGKGCPSGGKLQQLYTNRPSETRDGSYTLVCSCGNAFPRSPYQVRIRVSYKSGQTARSDGKVKWLIETNKSKMNSCHARANDRNDRGEPVEINGDYKSMLQSMMDVAP